MSITFLTKSDPQPARTTTGGRTLWTVALATSAPAGAVLLAWTVTQNTNAHAFVPEGSGWSYLGSATASNGKTLRVWSKIATTTTTQVVFAYTGTTPYSNSYGAVAYGGDASGIQSAQFTANGADAPSLTAQRAGDVLVCMWTYFTGDTITLPTDLTTRSWQDNVRLGTRSIATTGPTGTETATGSAASYTWPNASILIIANRAPNAPTGLTPASGSTLRRTTTNQLGWTFSDPDTGDSQSKYRLRYRLTGATTWTTVTKSTPATHWTAPATALPAGTVEWQVRTYDALGAVSSWSSSSFLSVATEPTLPTITAPTNGSTVVQSVTCTWSYPTQEAYEVRRVADATGTADPTTVYSDTGTVTTAAARSVALTFAVNGRSEHVQLRVKATGLWTGWADVLVHVSYTGPPTPTVTLSTNDATGSITVSVSIPTPATGEPTVAHLDIYRSSATEAEIRVAATRAPATSWTDYLPASGVSYTYRVVAVATNGTTSTGSAT